VITSYVIAAWCRYAPGTTHPGRWVFSFLGATLHPLTAKIHDDPRILRPATADSVAMLPHTPAGVRGSERRRRWAVHADVLQPGLSPSRGWRGPQAERPRTRAPCTALPPVTWSWGSAQEGRCPYIRSACRPEGPATPVTIIMGVYFESPRQTPVGTRLESHRLPKSPPWTTAPPTAWGRWMAYGSAVPHLGKILSLRAELR